VPPGLGHDDRVDVAVVVWEGRDVLKAPSTALFRGRRKVGGVRGPRCQHRT
jgi:hypothetical protein